MRSRAGRTSWSTATQRRRATSSRARIRRSSTAADGSRSIWLSLVDAVPFVGNSSEAIRAVADAGVQTADAAEGLAAAVADLPGGLGALAPTTEGIPIDRLSALTEATARADELTGAALDTLESAPTGFVLGPVTSAPEPTRWPSSRSCTASCTPAR